MRKIPKRKNLQKWGHYISTENLSIRHTRGVVTVVAREFHLLYYQ